ncbi:MAG: hypothetical protein M3Q03_07980 [Chloroflexota bacterium]|nr:hypothetical protein [Chloroflexota bacterium]
MSISNHPPTPDARSGWRPVLAVAVALLAGLAAADGVPLAVAMLALLGLAAAALGGGMAFRSGEWFVTVLGMANMGIAIGALRDGEIRGEMGLLFAAMPVLALCVGVGVAVGLARSRQSRE